MTLGPSQKRPSGLGSTSGSTLSETGLWSAVPVAAMPKPVVTAARSSPIDHRHMRIIVASGGSMPPPSCCITGSRMMAAMTTVSVLMAAQRAQAEGDLPGAIEAYEMLLAQRPPVELEAGICFNLASAHRALDHHDDAVAAAQRAVELAGDAVSYAQLGLCLTARGQPEEAVVAHERALALPLDESTVTGTWVNLGNARRRAGDREGAARAYRHALRLRPDYGPAHYNLHACLFRDEDPGPALEHLDRAVGVRWAPALAWAIRQRRDPSSPPPDAPPFLLDSLRFALAHPDAVWLSDTFATLDHALAITTRAGDVVELGVRFGTSLRHLARRLSSRPRRRLHGFDSFEGLPEAWGGQAPGLYSTGGRQPAVPEGVTLHPGWFRETLPPFVAEAGPIALVHVDCDIYTSTRTALEALAPRLGPGAILVFDDYLANPNWREDEHAALLETAAAHGWCLRYRAFSPFSRQAVVELSGGACSDAAGPG